MKVIVTGGTGFLGSHLTKALLAKGHEVIVLKRTFSDVFRIRDVLSEVITYNLDICDLSKPFIEQKNIGAVIHMATSYGRSSESIFDLIESNLVFPLHLLELSSKYRVEFFFNTDTFFNSPKNKLKYLNSYIQTKKHFLDWGKTFSETGLIRFLNIKLEHVYGPFDSESKFVTSIVKKCITGEKEIKLTYGEQQRDFIYIDDVVRAYTLLLEKKDDLEGGYLNFELGTGRAVAVRDFVEMVHKISKSESKLKFGALEYRENEIMFSCANNSKLKQMGWEAIIPVEVGIKKIIENISV